MEEKKILWLFCGNAAAKYLMDPVSSRNEKDLWPVERRITTREFTFQRGIASSTLDFGRSVTAFRLDHGTVCVSVCFIYTERCNRLHARKEQVKHCYVKQQHTQKKLCLHKQKEREGRKCKHGSRVAYKHKTPAVRE